LLAFFDPVLGAIFIAEIGDVTRFPGPAEWPASRRPNESHTTSVGSRVENDEPNAQVKPCPGSALP
jgi:hypothetical protein